MNSAVRCALLVVVALTAGSRLALAQQWACYTIHAGDTATHLAQRMTGSARNVSQPWFQILDTDGARFLAKHRYHHIRAGWRVCLVIESAGSAAIPVSAGTTPARVPAVLSGMTESLTRLQLNPWWSLLMLLLATALACHAGDRYWRERQAIVDVMKRFGEAFIGEFERPLIPHRAGEHAIRSRLRFTPSRHRLEVHLAPAAGRGYPNLSDHRKNVEYDVERVVRSLGDHPFISGSPRQQGEWVVVPFQVHIHQKQEGVA